MCSVMIDAGKWLMTAEIDEFLEWLVLRIRSIVDGDRSLIDF